MKERRWLIALVAVVFVSPVPVAFASSARAEHDASVVELLEWFLAREGTFFNPKQEIRCEIPGDTCTSLELGIFATERIQKGELLTSVPWDTTINAGYEVEKSRPLACDTVRNLIREMRLDKESEFAPYVVFLLQQERHRLPSEWSDAGKALLNDVLAGDDLPPLDATGWIENDWREGCNGSDDPFEENAAMLVVQRADDDVMLPVWDMYKHRNGKYRNTEVNRTEGVKFELTASRDIEKGEQIHNSLNMCRDCKGRADNYGTPEIFRDYGFIEQMPQRWVFGLEAFVIQERADGSNELEVQEVSSSQPPNLRLDFLRRQILRLEKLQTLEENNRYIPRYETDRILEYAQALVEAMKHVLKKALGDEFGEKMCPGEKPGYKTCIVSDGYDELEDEVDDLLYYEVDTCDSEEIMEFEDYSILESVKSVYQDMNFCKSREQDDVCFDIEDTVQICSNYRPYYHEYMVDFPARYIDAVRRVLFVGGGDSMLLYEALKYPSLEAVVGLELDQKVVRKSFKYFHTQPYFDNDKVEWWFGDAAKSLLMLPKDYFGSFDLVLVDLSETAMSLAVTNELDMFEALALLLKPEGIMVKNEQYLDKLSAIFDYTTQIIFQNVPVLCDQAMVMGSNKVDFWRQSKKDHQVKTLLLEPLDQFEDRFHLFHDYQKNVAQTKGSCDESEELSGGSDRLERHAGILMIADVENATADLQPSTAIKKALAEALQDEGLSLLSTVAPAPGDGTAVAVIIVAKEGYVAARTWPEHKYCAFDIHLWGAFDSVERVRDALVAAVGGSNPSTSSFRIVVGGMHGTSTWNEDQKAIGPRITQRLNCNKDAEEVGLINDQRSVNIVEEEMMSLVQDRDVVAAVLCGAQGEPCKSLDNVGKNANVRDVIALWTCPGIAGDSQYSEDMASRMIECEKETIWALWKAVAEKDQINAFVVDASAPIAMVKIADSIWNSQRNQHSFLKLTGNLVFIAVMPDHIETWRKKHNFIDRTRKRLKYDPLFSAELVLNNTEGKMEIGVLSSEDPHFFRHLDSVAKSIERRAGLGAEVRKVQGALFKDQSTTYEPRKFKASDYDLGPGKEQFTNQNPLGRQSIFQLDLEDGSATFMSPSIIRDGVRHALLQMKYSVTEMQSFADVGDGSMFAAFFSGGSVSAVFDGNAHVDINLFTYDEDEEMASEFVDIFLGKVPGMKLSLRDEQPRGTGRVINFREDLKYSASSFFL